MERQITTKNSRRSGAPVAKQPRSVRAPAHPILTLQQTIGNQAVQRLLQSPQFQAKLQISQPGDPYEQEADRVADAVMRIPEPVLPEEKQTPVQTKPLAAQISPLVQRELEPEPEEASEEVTAVQPLLQRAPVAVREDDEEEVQTKSLFSTGSIVQRFCAECEDEPVQTKETANQTPALAPHAEAQVSNLQSSGGEPLSESTRAFFEPRFGQDFSQVRIHQGSQAAASARAVNARAYTMGRSIAFGAGEYAPETMEGKQLLAHELTHVVQQSELDGIHIGQSNEKPGFPAISRYANGGIQKKDGQTVRIPALVHFDQPLSKEEFIQLVNAQFNLPANTGWINVKEHYNTSESPVKVLVSASKMQKGRAEKTASDIGFDIDASGSIEGASGRAEEFSKMPFGREKQAIVKEIDRRYWKATGIKKGTKIHDKTKETGEVALWNQIRDEVLAEGLFIRNLPENVQHILRYSKDGIVVTPENYEQVVRIANKVKQLDAADLENYLREVRETKDFNVLENSINNFLQTREAAPGKIKDLLVKIRDEDWDTDSEAANLDAKTMFYLSLDQRIKVIKDIAGGHFVGDEDEQTIIRLLTSTPSSDLKALMAELKKSESALLKQLERVIHGSENKEYYAALRNIIFQTLEPEEAQEKMESAKIFPWSDPSFLKGYTNARFYYETVEYTKEGKIRVVYWFSYLVTGKQSKEYLLEPDEIIGLQFYMDEDFANAKKGETIFMPAANLLAFKNEQFSRELNLMVDVGLLFAGGAGLVAKGTRLAKVIAILDTTLAVAAITINSFRSDIAKTEEGRQFLRAWDTVNTLIAVYGIGRVVIRLPETFRNLKKAYQGFKGNPGKIDPSDLNKIENETATLFNQADKAVFESELAELRKKFSADQMAAFEKQLEKASGIADTKKRQAAIAEIESHISTMSRLPNRPGGKGKTTGITVLEGEEFPPIVSGKEGYAEAMPKGSRGFNGQARTHVEGHTAALMHQTGAKKGVLYINNPPCAGLPGCDAMLPRMLPPGAELRVIGPKGFDKTYIGLPE